MARAPRASEIALRMEYLEYAQSLEQRATDDIAGVWYSRLGASKHAAGELSQWDMFTAPWHHVARYASEELTQWFADHGRLSFTAYREQTRQSMRDAFEAYSVTKNAYEPEFAPSAYSW